MLNCGWWEPGGRVNLSGAIGVDVVDLGLEVWGMVYCLYSSRMSG